MYQILKKGKSLKNKTIISNRRSFKTQANQILNFPLSMILLPLPLQPDVAYLLNRKAMYKLCNDQKQYWLTLMTKCMVWTENIISALVHIY